MIPDDRYYARGHEWVKLDEALVLVGVTEPLLRRLSPLISLELPEPDDEMKPDLPFGEVEGLSESFALRAPVEARIIEVHDELIWDLDKLTDDPYGEGWLLKIRVHDPQELKKLVPADSYREFCREDLGEEYVGD